MYFPGGNTWTTFTVRAYLAIKKELTLPLDVRTYHEYNFIYVSVYKSYYRRYVK
jgi:hypothetical protein